MGIVVYFWAWPEQEMVVDMAMRELSEDNVHSRE